MKVVKIYRDTVWGDIELDELAVKIIDTPEFQRLDGIKQLGFADYVYRGAKHTRFSHSVGVYHVTKKIIEAVVENQKRMNIPPPEELSGFGGNGGDEYDVFAKRMETIKKIVSIAGLLHDITHIPFGHSLEDEIPLYSKHDSIDSLRLYYLLFDKKSEIKKIFMKEDPWIPPFSNEKLLKLIFVILKYKCIITSSKIKNFSELLEDRIEKEKNNPEKEKLGMVEKLRDWYNDFKEEKIFHPFMCDIFGNTMCADLLDYLIRDSQGTGLQMIYDEKIFKFFFIGKDINNGEHRLALSIFDKRGDERFDVLSEILEIMQMRHALAERVYYHKTKAIATSMLISILNKQRKKLPKDSNPYEDQDSILTFTDSKLFEYLTGICRSDSKQAELLSMIKNRRLYKVGAIITARSAENLDLNISENFVRPYHDDKDHKEKEKRLNEKIQMKNKVMIYCPPEHPQAKEIQTFIQTRDKTRVTPLNQVKHDLTITQQVNFLSKEKYKNLWNFFLFLHPDDSKNEIIVSKIITKFCKCLLVDDQLSKNLIRDKDFIKHSKYQSLTKLRGDLLDEWKEKKDGELAKNIPEPTLASFMSEKCSIISPKIFMDMKNIVSNDTTWKDHENSDFTKKEEYFDAFDMIWWNVFIEKPKSEIDTPKSGKLDEVGSAVDRIREFQKSLIEGAATSREGKTFREGLREAEKLLINEIIEG